MFKCAHTLHFMAAVYHIGVYTLYVQWQVICQSFPGLEQK